MKNKLEKDINKLELNEVIGLSKKILKLLYVVFIAALILTTIIAVQKVHILPIVLEFISVISPFFIGFIFAWLLRPVVLKLNKKIHNNTLSSILVFSLFVIILFILLYTFIPTVYNEVNELVGLLPGFVESITRKINELFTSLESNGLNLKDFQSKLLLTITNYSSEIASDLPNTVINIVMALFSGIGTFVMGTIIGVYLLIDYENIGKYFKKIIPKKISDDVTYLSERIGSEVRKCVNGTFVVALVVMLFDSILFALIGLKAPILFGLICGLTDLIPFIGPYIGGGVAVIVGLTQDPLIGIGALISCVIVQIVENYILQPIVMSKASQTHPVIIIIALLVFGHFFGIIGMILAAPILTILRVIIEFIITKVKNYEKRTI